MRFLIPMAHLPSKKSSRSLPVPIVDTVEGTVYFINSSTNAINLTQFSMIITNLIAAATNSLIGSLSLGSS